MRELWRKVAAHEEELVEEVANLLRSEVALFLLVVDHIEQELCLAVYTVTGQ